MSGVERAVAREVACVQRDHQIEVFVGQLGDDRFVARQEADVVRRDGIGASDDARLAQRRERLRQPQRRAKRVRVGIHMRQEEDAPGRAQQLPRLRRQRWIDFVRQQRR